MAGDRWQSRSDRGSDAGLVEFPTPQERPANEVILSGIPRNEDMESKDPAPWQRTWLCNQRERDAVPR